MCLELADLLVANGALELSPLERHKRGWPMVEMDMKDVYDLAKLDAKLKQINA